MPKLTKMTMKDLEARTVVRNGLACCTTCTKPVKHPARVYDDRGNVVHGCVDACHTGQLQPISASNRWHNRPEAKKLRAATLKFLNS